MRFEAGRQPHLLGASVFGYNDAFCRLQPFLRKWRAAGEAAAAGGGSPLQPYIGAPRGRAASPLQGCPRPPLAGMVLPVTARAIQLAHSLVCPSGVLSAVSVDVTRAFDHVDIPLLLSLAEPLLQQEQYLVLKYSEVQLLYCTVLHGNRVIPHAARAAVAPPRSRPDLPCLARALAHPLRSCLPSSLPRVHPSCPSLVPLPHPHRWSPAWAR